MYQALYRKWRPATFDDVAGQEHITKTLKRQVLSGRLSHAYLFVGTRGTGKTTCAKILAKAVNCEHTVDGNPCNKCRICLGIDSGEIMDVVEMDAATNNGVNDVRALREEAVFSPINTKRRVYIIDEVHMLSGSAFNALLKTLEEPPEHLTFILATTEIHRVPATILSRCQRHSFRRLLPHDIISRLNYVAQQENIALNADAAELLAEIADGAMRDALSLLDQCVSGDGEVDAERVRDAVGLSERGEVVKTARAIAAGDAAAAISVLESEYMGGKDLAAFLDELSRLFRDLLLFGLAPRGGAGLMTGGFGSAVIAELSAKFSTSQLIACLDILEDGIASLNRSSTRKTPAELCLIKLCSETGVAHIEQKIAEIIPNVAQNNYIPPKIQQNVAEDRNTGEPHSQQAALTQAETLVKAEVPEAPELNSTPEIPEAHEFAAAQEVPAAILPAPPAQPQTDNVTAKFLAALTPQVSPFFDKKLTRAELKDGIVSVHISDQQNASMVNGKMRGDVEKAASEAAGSQIKLKLFLDGAEVLPVSNRTSGLSKYPNVSYV